MEWRVQGEVGENRLDLTSQGLKLVMWGPHLELQVKFSIGSKAVCFCAINGSLIRNTLTPEVARQREWMQEGWKPQLCSFFGISSSVTEMWAARKPHGVSEFFLSSFSYTPVILCLRKPYPLRRSDEDMYMPLEGIYRACGEEVFMKELKITFFTELILIRTAVVHQDKQLQSESSFF